MISPVNPLGTLNPAAGGGPGLLGGPAAGGDSPLGDLSALSPEALEGQGGDVSEAIKQMLEAMQQQQQQDPVEKLKEEIAKTEQELQQAQQSGDEEKVAQLGQKLQQLYAQLAQLTGQGGDQGGGDPAGAGAPGGGAPGGGAPGGGAPGGGAPGGGGPGGGAPGGGAPGGGAPGGGAPGGGSPGGGAPAGASPGGGNNVGGPADINPVPPELAGDDKKLAEFIEGKLAGTPLEGQGLGSHFVAAGRKHDVDPMALVAISKHETNFGKLGVGVRKHMGVGAFDSSPNTPRRWDGAVNQIYSGAKTFANLRRKGGSNSGAPLSQQLAAVNRGGWATDGNWHRGVARHYNSLSQGGNTMLASNTTRRS